MQEYLYTHTSTEATTGYFSCEPHPRPELGEALRYISRHPRDSFMRRHLLSRLINVSSAEVRALLELTFSPGDIPLPVQSLLEELALLHGEQSPASKDSLPGSDIGDVKSDAQSPLIFLRWSLLPDRELQKRWRTLFWENIRHHRALPKAKESGLPPLYPDQEEALSEPSRLLPGLSRAFTAPFSTHIATVHKGYLRLPENAYPIKKRPEARETAELAEQRLKALEILAGPEMRHTASLSPIALLRPWNMRLSLRQGRHDIQLHGQATTYGRGLALEDARASCLMEMVERASSYLSIEEDRVLNISEPTPLRSGSRSIIMDLFGKAVDPADFPSEVPYNDEELCWIRGVKSDNSEIFVPIQMAGLFCNLDEIDLSDAPGSTGIATGNTLEEAKLAALLEVIERDAEATTPFAKSSCFVLEADPALDPVVAALLADYKARGINVQFQDITGPLGIPVYQCFVMSTKGVISRGYGAGLSSRKAVISALTETPFPYPDGGPSGPLLRKLPVRQLHELPEYSLTSTAANVAMLEELLALNGRMPVYINLTNKGLDFPVVRALIPGMELGSDSDGFSRVPWRLYSNYLRLFDEKNEPH